MPDSSEIDDPGPFFSRTRVLAGLALAAMLIGGYGFADWWTCLPADATAAYVGRQSCIQCHQQEAKLWEGSHHDLAMDLASDETVLADFDNAELEHDGITSRMFRRDGKFLVHTEGPDGELSDFEVKYVFGVDPLQQYMVEFDRRDDVGDDEIARLQVLRLTWDTEQGKWFYLRPPDVAEKLAPDDPLHWTGPGQRWNIMCADCHSTNLRKNFDVPSKTYHTTFSEIDVSCEACHGPGGLHVEIANTKGLFWDRKHGYGLAKLKGASTKPQLDTCFQCHSRRNRVVKAGYHGGEDFYDYFGNELLLENSYFPDGQIMDEVYVHGSFIQSKMYHKNIRCTDCHDPHTARLKHDGNQVCTSCHQHSAGKYDTPVHHHHKPDGKGASCVECHMPETTYMTVDARRDHSLRVPRPDLSEKLGTPNACTRCHLDRAKLPDDKRQGFTQYLDWMLAARTDAAVKESLAEVDRWAAESFKTWYGEKKDVATHYANVLTEARRGAAGAEDDLTALAENKQLPGIVRATCLYELGRYAPDLVVQASTPLLDDADPQVRTTATGNMQMLNDTRQLMKLLLPILEDPVRSVRTEAAHVLARIPNGYFNGDQRRLLRSVLEEFEEGVRVNDDRADSHLALGSLYEIRGDLKAARKAYETAIDLEPHVALARTNLAALLERQAEEAESNAQRQAQNNREAAIESIRQSQELRQQVARLRREELEILRDNARLLPDSAAIQHRFGLSLYLHGQYDEAEEAIAKAVRIEPNSPDYVLALALLYRQQQRFDEALELVERVLELRPDDRSYQQLLVEVQREAAASGADR